MLIIPPERKSNSSEEYVKDLLSEINWKDAPQARAYWSLLIPEHETKPWSECDFIIAWDRALICLEVKGGHSISCSEGIWKYTNAEGKSFHKSESPMEQVSTCSAAIRRRLENELGAGTVNKFIIGWGVVFPYHDFHEISGFEFDTSTAIDKSGINQSGLGGFIKNLEAHWRDKINTHSKLGANKEECAKTFKYLRGEFELIRPISSYIEEYEKKIFIATEEQLTLLESIQLNRSYLCEGGAGTGKTLMAIEVAKMKKAENKRVGFVCRNHQFALYARSVLSKYEVTVICTETLDLDNPPDVFDCIIVDEGQDCMTVNQVAIIDGLVKDGLSEGSCYWFMDKNNQSHFYNDFDIQCLDFLADFPRHNLSFNCRNTKPMIELIKSVTNGDCGKPKIESPGLEPSIKAGFDDKQAQASELSNVIIELIDGGAQPSDITILTVLDTKESCVNSVINNLSPLIGRPNKQDRLQNKIEFFDVVSFKGQENKIVIVVDLFDIDQEDHSVAMLYTSFSRPNQHLIALLSKKAHNTILDLLRLKQE